MALLRIRQLTYECLRGVSLSLSLSPSLSLTHMHSFSLSLPHKGNTVSLSSATRRAEVCEAVWCFSLSLPSSLSPSLSHHTHSLSHTQVHLATSHIKAGPAAHLKQAERHQIKDALAAFNTHVEKTLANDEIHIDDRDLRASLARAADSFVVPVTLSLAVSLSLFCCLARSCACACAL